MCFKFFVFLISERFDDSEECLNRLAKPNMNEDVHMNEPKNPEDRLPDMVQDFFRAQEGGAQNSMFAANEGGFPDFKNHVRTCFIFHFNPLLLEVFLIIGTLWHAQGEDLCSDLFAFEDIEFYGSLREIIHGHRQMGLKEIEVQINEHESIICRGRDRSMGFKLPTNPYGNNDNFLCFFMKI
ncbi:hypothetical protein ACJX0J_028245 [Zea mays]